MLFSGCVPSCGAVCCFSGALWGCRRCSGGAGVALGGAGVALGVQALLLRSLQALLIALQALRLWSVQTLLLGVCYGAAVPILALLKILSRRYILVPHLSAGVRWRFVISVLSGNQ